MANFKRNDRDGNEKGKNLPNRMPRLEISASQCHVCTSEYRKHIEMQLALGMGMKPLSRFMSDLGVDVSRDSLARHWKNHSSNTDAAIRRIWEKRAKEVFHKIEEVEGFITTHEGLLEVMLEKFKEAMLSDEIIWTAQDAIKVIDKLERYMATKGEMKVEVVMMQARLFGEAVRNILPPAMHEQILVEYDRLIAQREAVIAAEDVVLGTAAELPPGD